MALGLGSHLYGEGGSGHRNGPQVGQAIFMGNGETQGGGSLARLAILWAKDLRSEEAIHCEKFRQAILMAMENKTAYTY